MLSDVFFEKKPFKIYFTNIYSVEGNTVADIVVGRGLIHLLSAISDNKIEVSNVEKDILETNLSKLTITRDKSKIFVKIKHSIVKDYDDMTIEEKNYLRDGINNTKNETGSYTAKPTFGLVNSAELLNDSEIPERNESETCIEIGAVSFYDKYAEIDQKLKSDIFFSPCFVGTDTPSSEESSEASSEESSEYSSEESSEESSTEGSGTPSYIPSDYSDYDSSDADSGGGGGGGVGSDVPSDTGSDLSSP